MFIYVPDWYMYYHLDAFRYDKDHHELILTVCSCQLEIIVKDISIPQFKKFRYNILRDSFFELSKDFKWDMKQI